MPPGQRIELIVGDRRGGSIAIPAEYVDDVAPGSGEAPRRLNDEERRAVVRASTLIANAIGGTPVDEVEMQHAVELLHRLSRGTEGEPRFRLVDGRLVSGENLSYRAALG